MSVANAVYGRDLLQFDFNALEARTDAEGADSVERSTDANDFETLHLRPYGAADVDACRSGAGKTECRECFEERSFELERYAEWDESDEA